MKRLFLSLAVVCLGCLAIPANLGAQDAKDYFSRGIDSLQNGKYDQAVAEFTEVLRLKTDYAKAYYNRGVAYQKKANTTRPSPTSAKH